VLLRTGRGSDTSAEGRRVLVALAPSVLWGNPFFFLFFFFFFFFFFFLWLFHARPARPYFERAVEGGNSFILDALIFGRRMGTRNCRAARLSCGRKLRAVTTYYHCGTLSGCSSRPGGLLVHNALDKRTLLPCKSIITHFMGNGASAVVGAVVARQ